MSEIKREVKVFETVYVCDDCEKVPNPGCILLNTNVFSLPNLKYVYKCPNCNKEYRLEDPYPLITYELVDNLD